MGLILIILVAGIVVWLVTQHRASEHETCTTTAVPSEPALEILRKRYARGEIGREEFEERRRALEVN